MGMFDWLTGNKAADPNVPQSDAATLTAALLALNRDDLPWLIELGEAGGRADLIARWKLDDPRWREAFTVGLSAGVTTKLKLHEDRHEVRSVDEQFTADFSVFPPRLKIGGSRGQTWSSGTTMTFSTGDGIKKTGEAHFDSNDMKAPLRDTVAAHGWAWHGVVLGRL